MCMKFSSDRMKSNNAAVPQMPHSTKWLIFSSGICLLSVSQCYPIVHPPKNSQFLNLQRTILDYGKNVRLKRWLPDQIVPMTKQQYNNASEVLKEMKERNSSEDQQKIKDMEKKMKMEDEFIEQQKAINATIDGEAIDIFGNKIQLNNPSPRPSWIQTVNGWVDREDEKVEGGLLEKDYADDSRSGTGKLLCALVEDHLKKSNDSESSTVTDKVEVIKAGCKPTESNEIEVNIKQYGFNEYEIREFKTVFDDIGIRMDDEGNVMKLSEKSKEKIRKMCDNPAVWAEIDQQLDDSTEDSI